MAYVVGVTRGGREWTPGFITALDDEKCIGCGRCYKVCPREVFEPIERDPDDDYQDDGFSDDTALVMSIADALDCIGCEACSKVCPKKCHTHEPAAMAAVA